MLSQRERVLPAGYIDAQGQVHKLIELTPLTGREEELLTQNDYPTATLVTEVLSRCVRRIGSISDVTPSIMRELLVADRQYLLLMLRQLTFGDRVQASLPCPWPDCGKGVDIDFLISKIPVTECSELRRHYQLEIDGGNVAETLGLRPAEKLTVKYRLPNGGDQEAVLDNPQRPEIERMSMLFSRCILMVNEMERPAPEWIMRLPPDIRMQIEQAVESRAPNLELSMEIDCPECRRIFVAPFELQDFFFAELKQGSDLLFREVHYLAFHYHWSEQEIMAMPRKHRRHYIEVLAGEIEKLNDRIDQ
jgi:hypothetical protein